MKFMSTLSCTNSRRAISYGFLLGIALAGLVILPACSMNVKDQQANDGGKKVDIETPLGSMHVNEDVKGQDFGVAVYPGARRRSDGEDKHGANVNMAFGGFGLKVVAAEFESDDSPEKIKTFYRSALQKYGKILECVGGAGSDIDFHVGKNENSNSKDLTCDAGSDSKNGHVQLKVGTKENQHVVGIEPQAAGTRFGLAHVQMHTGKGDEI